MTGLPKPPLPLQRRWILSLSGGGYRGLFTAQYLARLEQEIGRPLYTAFDLIAGTSIGSILALGLASGIPAADLVRFFDTKGKAIFPPRPIWQRPQALFRPKFSSTDLARALQRAFKDSTFSNLKSHVVVPAVSLVDSAPVVFRSRNGPLPASKESLKDAALASSAAPTYFPPHVIGTQHYVDGGLIANSPDAFAVVEATAVLGWRLDSVSLLSVGTTAVETGLPALQNRMRWGALRWGWKLTLLEQMMTAQAKLSRESARMSLGSRFLSVDAIRANAQDKVIALDRATIEATNTLKSLALGAWERMKNEHPAVLEAIKLHHR
jgi:predicted acylesterase/phospholipase RssA